MSALEEIRARVKNQLDSLNMLDLSSIKIGSFTDAIRHELERFKKVKVLILRGCGLDSLDNMPNWKLSAIDLSENKFTDSVINKLLTISSLTQILLMDNNITSLQGLKQLSSLKHLSELDFSNCPVTGEPNYRPILFDSIKSLEILDQKDLGGDYVPEEQEDEEESEYNDDDEYSDEEEFDEDEEQESSEKPKTKKKK